MKKNGINKSVTAGFGWTNHELAILVNDYILLSKKQFPEEIIPFCSLDINSKKSEEELLRCISKGVKGIGELHINNLENILDNKIFNNILKIALHYNLPIIIHGSEPLGHKYKGKGRSYPKFLFKFSFSAMTYDCSTALVKATYNKLKLSSSNSSLCCW